jgi:hypothetical protein
MRRWYVQIAAFRTVDCEIFNLSLATDGAATAASSCGIKGVDTVTVIDNMLSIRVDHE